MTKEMKIKVMLDEYDEKMKKLSKEYSRRWNNLPLNRYGEVIAENVLKLNMWHVEAENKIKNDLTMAVMALDS